jgi:hypothetical protein
MTRIYEVTFAHIKKGRTWSRRQVAVDGYVEEAIEKAKQLLTTSVLLTPSEKKFLKAEEVRLLAQGE